MGAPETTFMEKGSQVIVFVCWHWTPSSSTFSFGGWRQSNLLAESVPYSLYWKFLGWSLGHVDASKVDQFVTSDPKRLCQQVYIYLSGEVINQFRVLTIPTATSWGHVTLQTTAWNSAVAAGLRGVPFTGELNQQCFTRPTLTAPGRAGIWEDWQDVDSDRLPRWLRCHHLRRSTGVK